MFKKMQPAKLKFTKEKAKRFALKNFFKHEVFTTDRAERRKQLDSMRVKVERNRERPRMIQYPTALNF